MSSSTPTDLVTNHHLRGDDDEFIVLSTGAPLAPDKMVELREAAKLLGHAEPEQ